MSIDDFARAHEGVPGSEADAVDGVVPRWVIRPESIDAVQTAVRAARDAGATLVASGLGAHLDIGAPPASVDVLLRLDRMCRIVDHAAADMTVTVAAGCSLAELDATLGAAGQWLPADPPALARTTVGGLIAANLSGPLRTSQGSVRDLLIGLRAVGADGALVSSGGRVVKNVAGYDLPKLHIGALGTLAVLVEATFKLRPRPEREAVLVLHTRGSDADAAQQIAGAALALRDDLDPLWLEIIGPGITDSSLPFRSDVWSVAVGLGGLAVEIEGATERVRALTAKLALEAGLSVGPAGPQTTGANGSPGAPELRQHLADFSLTSAPAVLRGATLPSGVGALLARGIAAAAEIGVRVACTAQPVTGIVRFAVAPREAPIGMLADRSGPRASSHEAWRAVREAPAGTMAAIVRALVARLRPALEAQQGALVIERAIPAVKHLLVADPGIWGDPGEGLGLMQRIKQTFDPDRRLAPGRFGGF